MFRFYRKKMLRAFVINMIIGFVLLAAFLVFCDYVLNGMLLDFATSIMRNGFYFDIMNMGILIYAFLILYHTIKKDEKVIRNMNHSLSNITTPMQKSKNSEFDDLWKLLKEKQDEFINVKQRIDEIEDEKKHYLRVLVQDMKIPIQQMQMLLGFMKDIPEIRVERYYTQAFQQSIQLEENINQFFQIARLEMYEVQDKGEDVSIARILEQLLDEHNNEFITKDIQVLKQMDYPCLLHLDVDLLVSTFQAMMENFLIYDRSGASWEILLEDGITDVRLRLRCPGNPIKNYDLQELKKKLPQKDDKGHTSMGFAFFNKAMNCLKGSYELVYKNGCLNVTLWFKK